MYLKLLKAKIMYIEMNRYTIYYTFTYLYYLCIILGAALSNLS